MNTWRPRVEHAQIFQPRDLQRIGRLGGWFKSLCDWLLQTLVHSHCERTAITGVCPAFLRHSCDNIDLHCRLSDMNYAETRLVP